MQFGSFPFVGAIRGLQSAQKEGKNGEQSYQAEKVYFLGKYKSTEKIKFTSCSCTSIVLGVPVHLIIQDVNRTHLGI